MEIKNKDVIKETPSIKITSPANKHSELRRRVGQEDKPFGWYETNTQLPQASVLESAADSLMSKFENKLEEINEKRKEFTTAVVDAIAPAPKPIMEEFESKLGEIAAKREEVMSKDLIESDSEDEVDESANLREQLAAMMEREEASRKEKADLEQRLEELSGKYNADEKALASFQDEKARYTSLINVQQRKTFDFQQDIIALKNQLAFEHESLMKTQEQLDTIKRHKAAKRSARKAAKKSSPKQSEDNNNVEKSVEEKPVEEAHSAWNVGHAKGFTEMVAEAQQEELSHPKKFSDILKESIKVEKESHAVKPSSDEFTVIGGDLSSQHVMAPLATN